MVSIRLLYFPHRCVLVCSRKKVISHTKTTMGIFNIQILFVEMSSDMKMTGNIFRSAFIRVFIFIRERPNCQPLDPAQWVVTFANA